jgi:hypothetical protein
MQTRVFVAAVVAGVLIPSLALAKNKSKSTLPADVVQARTVSVVIDPTAGVSLDDPQANQVAQRDVETAFLKWGRFQPVLDGQSADLIIVVRRGTGKMANATVHDPEQNRRPVVVDPVETGIGVGVQRGHPPPYAGGSQDASQGRSIPDPAGPQNGQMPDDRASPQMEIGNSTSEDSFLVYRGRTEKPLDGPVVWRYEAKNALKPHNVPAVDAFRKAVDQSEQAAAKQP